MLDAQFSQSSASKGMQVPEFLLTIQSLTRLWNNQLINKLLQTYDQATLL